MSCMYIHVQNESLSMISNFLLQYNIVKQNVTLEFLNIITLLSIMFLNSWVFHTT